MNAVAMRQVAITSPQGLHARPADRIARLANKFASTIEVIREGQSANGKSILEILLLAALEDPTLTIVATGRDACEAVDALVQTIEQIGVEETAEVAGDGSGTTEPARTCRSS